MPSQDEPPSSPPNRATSSEDAIAYYKAQYEQLESELADFQASSRELEAELERDVEASEKRERKLKEKVESLTYESDEWKTKCRQAKTEANTAQNNLQKEITTLRDSNRSLQLKLRDIEVQNDDFERQARHTTSSLEDLESKYNVAIERGVLLEEEIRTGEQEREKLRIESQRLRDELSDLKVETHIVQEKLNKAESQLDGKTPRKANGQAANGAPAQRRTNADTSPTTTDSSPSVATPPAKSVTSSVASDVHTPPSPPFSESSTTAPKPAPDRSVSRPGASVSELNNGVTRQSQASRASRHSRGPSFTMTNGRLTPSLAPRNNQPGLPQSGSLYQIRGLIGKMQKLEQRVQSARSRLPAPAETPPRVSPRTGSALDNNFVPSTVTMRSAKKRTSGSVASSRDGDSTPYRASTYSRASFGNPQATPSRRGKDESRPSSRTSMSSRCSVSALPQVSGRESRQSLTGGRNAHGGASSAGDYRPRSSLSNYNPSASMSYIDEHGSTTTPTPRRTTYSKTEASGSAIPTPGGSSQKRPSNGVAGSGIPAPRRTSTGVGRRDSDMPPPERKKSTVDLGETY